jgi:GntR family transcriptional regulator/MocR family aminotransferase
VAGTDLHLELTGPGLRAGLMDALREAVRTGRLVPGTRLPSTRSLAADLGVARNTVADAYAELIAEGWLTAQQGSGTRVARRAEPRPDAPSAPRTRLTPRHPTYGLLPGTPNLAEFPRTQWLTAARRALTAAPHDAFGYGDALGRVELRTVLADYLARARGVFAEPHRVVICAGFHHGLMLMAQALRARRVRAVAVESYGFDVYRDLLSSAGLRIPPLYVDESGARTGDLAGIHGVGALLTTPAHQYPTGVELRPDRRAAAVDWARATGGLILEDTTTESSIRPSAGGRSAASIRSGWCMLRRASPWRRVSGPPGWCCPGNWCGIVAAKGVRRLVQHAGPVDTASHRSGGTTVACARCGCATDAAASLVAALTQRVPRIRVTGMAAGLQAVLELPRGTERSVVQAAARQGLAVSGMAEFRYEVAGSGWQLPEQDALVVGYAAPSDSAWAGALEALCRAMP